MRTHRITALCLAGVAASLLLVGVESSTPVRHVVQIIPVAIALIVLARRPGWGALAAIPVFLFWSMIIVLIWLYLLGVTRVARGNYTTIEIVLTIFIAAFSIAGIAASVRLVAAPTWSHRVRVLFAFTFFGALQAAAMRASFLPWFADR